MGKIEKSAGGVSIIGGSDGPTSVFILGINKKKTLKQRIRNGDLGVERRGVQKRLSREPIPWMK